jgi:hypothetical protein
MTCTGVHDNPHGAIKLCSSKFAQVRCCPHSISPVQLCCHHGPVVGSTCCELLLTHRRPQGPASMPLKDWEGQPCSSCHSNCRATRHVHPLLAAACKCTSRCCCYHRCCFCQRTICGAAVTDCCCSGQAAAGDAVQAADDADSGNGCLHDRWARSRRQMMQTAAMGACMTGGLAPPTRGLTRAAW